MAESITIKALQDASLDAKSLEEVVNGNEVKQVTTRKGETYPSVKKAIKTLFENGGLPATPFATKALMTASALIDGKYAQVTDDTLNNGLYVKTAGAWVKSAYDPLVQSKTYTDNKVFKYSGVVSGKTSELTDKLSNQTILVTDFRTMTSVPPECTLTTAYVVVRNFGRFSTQEATSSNSLERWFRTLNSEVVGNNPTWTNISVKTTEHGQVFKGTVQADSIDIDTMVEYSRTLLLDVASISSKIPTDYPYNVAFFEVIPFGSTWVVHKLYPVTADARKVWTRIYRVNRNTVSSWSSPNESKSRFAGKRAVFMGDSITEFGDYPERVGEKTGLIPTNVGLGGSTAARRIGDYDGTSGVDIADAISTGDWTKVTDCINNLVPIGDDNTAQLQRLIATDWSKVDYIVNMYGTNDFTSNTLIGALDNLDEATYLGAVKYINEKILTAYPNISILWIAPLYRKYGALGILKTPNSNGDYLVDFVDGLAGQCELLSIPCYDLFRKCGINDINYTKFLGGVTHPNSTGYELLSSKVTGAFLSLM